MHLSVTMLASAPTSTSQVFRFLDLPGEIRNMIYPLLLDGEDQQTCKVEGYRTISIPLQFGHSIQGLYLPFSYAQCVRDVPGWARPKCTFAATIMHASPPILALNRQIRTEAKSLFLQRYLTLSFHSRDRSGNYPIGDSKLRSLKYWLTMLTPAEVAGIQRIELREFVWIASPEDGEKTRKWGKAGTALKEWHLEASLGHGCLSSDVWMGEIAAVELSVGHNSAALEVRSRLEIVEREAIPVGEHLQTMMQARKDAKSMFNGHDLIALACWLRATDKVPKRGYLKDKIVEILFPRWTMICSREELESGEWRTDDSKIKLGFRHLVARAELEN